MQINDAMVAKALDAYNEALSELTEKSPETRVSLDDTREAGLRAALTAALAEMWRPTHRHVKRGCTYTVIGQAEVQCSDGLTDYEVVTVYRAADGCLWVRRKAEFEDGRFEALPPLPMGRG